jgi:hypothetical protein
MSERKYPPKKNRVWKIKNVNLDAVTCQSFCWLHTSTLTRLGKSAAHLDWVSMYSKTLLRNYSYGSNMAVTSASPNRGSFRTCWGRLDDLVQPRYYSTDVFWNVEKCFLHLCIGLGNMVLWYCFVRNTPSCPEAIPISFFDKDKFTSIMCHR